MLRVEKISKHYDGVCALADVDFSVEPGEVHALMGENGAGKSTLAKIIAGSVKPDSGRILVDGQPARITSPLDAQRLGIAIIYQELDLFPSLSVAENIVIGNLRFERHQYVNFGELRDFCRPFLKQVGLDCAPDAPLESLSIGQMQLVAIARALSLDARLILMDEPTSSLFEDAAEILFRLIGELRERGVSIVYVSHKMDEIFRICQRVTVLRDGANAGLRRTAETNIDELIRMMVGREIRQDNTAGQRKTGELLLSASGLTTAKLRNVTFDLRRGEVLGVAGLVGAGRSELGAALFGLDPIQGGSISVHGRPFAPKSPDDAIRAGLGLVPEDRKVEGLMMQMSVLENSSLAVLKRMQRFGFVEQRRELDAVSSLEARLALKCPSRQAPVSALSGGNQQKVLLGRWLLVDPDVLFLDDPTRGIDIGAKQDIYGIIDELAAAGKGLILVSSELPELLRCCDRIIVLNEGRLTATFQRAEATQEKIMAAAAIALAGGEQ